MKTLLILSLSLIISSTVFAEIENPEELTGIQDHQTLTIKISELYNGGIRDDDGFGDADFKFTLEVEAKGYTPTGSRSYSLDSDEDVIDSDIFGMAIGDLDKEEKTIEIQGQQINDIVREFPAFSSDVRFVIRFYEDIPTAAGVFSAMILGELRMDRHIDLDFFDKETLKLGPLELLLTDSSSRTEIKVQEEVGFLGMGGVIEKTKTVGNFNSNSYAKLLIKID